MPLHNALWVEYGGRDFLFCGMAMQFYPRSPGQERHEVELRAQLRRSFLSDASTQHLVALRGPLQAATFEVTRACNLRCSYCYERDHGRGMPVVTMSPAAAEQAVAGLCRRFSNVRQVSFTGGEPLLNLPVIEQIADALHARGRSPRFRWFTNATTHIAPAITLSARLGMSWVVSLDGPKELHDAHRGAGTHDTVMATLAELSSRRIPFAISATFTPLHARAGFSPSTLSQQLRVAAPAATGVQVVPVSSPAFKFSLEEAAMLVEDQRRSLQEALDAFRRTPEAPLPDRAIRPVVAYLDKVRDDRVCPTSMDSKILFGVDGEMYPCLFFAHDPSSRYDGQTTLPPVGGTFDRLNHKALRTECADCFARYLCFGCPGGHLAADPELIEPGRSRADLHAVCDKPPLFAVIVRFLLAAEHDIFLHARLRNAIARRQSS